MNKEGIKADDGKLNLEILMLHFPNSLEGVARWCNYGAEKYNESVEIMNWSKVKNPVSRYRKALLRHLFAWFKGEFIDKESGLPHMTACIWNLLVLTEFLVYDKPQNNDVEFVSNINIPK